MNKYTVHLRAAPHTELAFKTGRVLVFAKNADDAGKRARAELQKGAFHGYPSQMFIVEKVESH